MLTYQNIIFFLIVYIPLFIYVFQWIRPLSSLKKLSASEFKNFIKTNRKNVVIIDVRSPQEYNHGHIIDALNYPYSRFRRTLKKHPIAQDKAILLYCRNGIISRRVAAILHDKGYQNLYQLQGGMLHWE